MPFKVAPKVQLKHYIKEHLANRGLGQKELADHLGIDQMTVSRWVRYVTKVDQDILAAIAEALVELKGGRLEWEDLLRHPDDPSPNQLMRRLPEEDQRHFMRQLHRAVDDLD